MINIKTPDQINIMRQGGHKLALIRDELATLVKSGITTKYLDEIAHKQILEAGGTPSFLDFEGYPASICTSVNEEVVHGIPSQRALKNGDIIGIDVGMKYKGFHNDTAITVPVGNITEEQKKLLEVTKNSLQKGIQQIKEGAYLGDIQNAIESEINKYNYGIVRELTGHGVGRELQEEPAIPNYGEKGTGPILKTGMVLAIEPMVTLGTWKINILSDGWTIVTADNSDCAHFEHTVAVTKNGHIVLTD